MNNAYKILREIRTLAPDWFWVPYLIPMTDTIERCRQYVDSGGIKDVAFDILDSTDQLQQIELHAGLFIPIENGKPLSKPIHIGGSVAEQAEVDAWKVYHKAQNEVIFDGWEQIWPESNNIHVINEEYNIILEFQKDVEGCLLSCIEKSHKKRLLKIEDLAKATSDNPLDLK